MIGELSLNALPLKHTRVGNPRDRVHRAGTGQYEAQERNEVVGVPSIPINLRGSHRGLSLLSA